MYRKYLEEKMKDADLEDNPEYKEELNRLMEIIDEYFEENIAEKV